MKTSENGSRSLYVFVAGVVTVMMTLFGTGVAQAVPSQVQTPDVAAVTLVDGSVVDQAALAKSLREIFTEVFVLNADGGVAYNSVAAHRVLGEETAKTIDELIVTSSVSTRGVSPNFLQCMFDSTVLGLVSGFVTGEFVALIERGEWMALAEKLLPKLVKAGVTGGVIGIAGGLAAGAVKCAFFS